MHFFFNFQFGDSNILLAYDCLQYTGHYRGTFSLNSLYGEHTEYPQVPSSSMNHLQVNIQLKHQRIR